MHIKLAFNFRFGKILQSKFAYRDRVSIVGQILDSIKRDPKGKTKTSIMRGANLNFDQVNKYLHFLELCDLVKAVEPVSSQELARYKLTGTGLNFLRDFGMWRRVLEMYQRSMI